MKLYKHTFSEKEGIKVTSIEVKETPKMYKAINNEQRLINWRSQISKDDIDKIIEWCCDFTMICTEYNISKFIEGIIDYKFNTIDCNDRRITELSKQNAELRSDILKLETKLQDLHY